MLSLFTFDLFLQGARTGRTWSEEGLTPRTWSWGSALRTEATPTRTSATPSSWESCRASFQTWVSVSAVHRFGFVPTWCTRTRPWLHGVRRLSQRCAVLQVPQQANWGTCHGADGSGLWQAYTFRLCRSYADFGCFSLPPSLSPSLHLSSITFYCPSTLCL